MLFPFDVVPLFGNKYLLRFQEYLVIRHPTIGGGLIAT
jgi:hypothetical protein